MKMNQLTALQELAEKVEAGEIGAGLNTSSCFSTGDNADMDAVDAYHGSLDAAKSLQQTLGKTSQYSIVTDPTCLKVTVCWWPDGLGGPEFYAEAWGMTDQPSRAWLLAHIRVRIAELETK